MTDRGALTRGGTNQDGALPPALRFGGVVLAGGRSRRMGRPKAWLPVAHRTMLEVVVEAVRGGIGAAAPIVVVGAPGQDLPPLAPGVLRVDDDIEGEGPLRGMGGGFRALAGRADAAYVSSCDVPLLRPAFVARVVASLGDADIAVPFVDGLHHPLSAAYRINLLDTVLGLLDAGLRRPYLLLERCRTRTLTTADLEPVDPQLDSLRNANTPEEYERLAAGRAPA